MTCRASLFAVLAASVLLVSPAAAQRYVESARLSPSVMATGGSRFGAAVAVDGTLVAIGAPGAAGGAVAVADLSAGSFLTPFGAPPGSSSFGAAVAMNTGLLVVGDPEFDGGRGRVAVYRRMPGTVFGTPTSLDLPADLVAAGGHFGASVALVPPDATGARDSMFLVVGAPGVGLAFLVSRPSTSPVRWEPSAATFEGAGGTIAACRSLEGDPVVLIGSADPSARQGVVVWRPRRTSGATTERLPNPGDVEGFGSALACAPGFAVVGAPGLGTALRYAERSDPTGVTYAADRAARLAPPLDGVAQSFGRSVGVLASGLAFVGAPKFEDRPGKGAAYAFPPEPPSTSRRFLLDADAVPELQGMGASLSVSTDGALAVVGDPEAGAAVVFRFEETPMACTGDADVACRGEPCVGGVCCDRPCAGECATCATGTCMRIPMCSPDAGGPLDAGSVLDDGGPLDASVIDGATPFDAGAPVVPLTRFAGGGGCRCAAAGRGEAGAAWLAVAGLSALLGMRRSRRASRR